MLEFLKKCNQQFGRLQCPKNKNDCHDCFKDGFYGGEDDYACLKGCYYYAIHYGPAYISEIYHFLSASKFLENIGPKSIIIASLGGGMGTDFWAIKRYKRDHELTINGQYVLFDKELQWQQIINQYSEKIKISKIDLSSETIHFHDTDVVFINKLFSTLKNHNLAKQFLQKFSESLLTLKKGAHVVFNDVNHRDKGRDIFHRFMVSSGNFSTQGQFYFPISNAYTGDYKQICKTGIIYDCSSLSLACDVMDTVRKTVFFYYKKEAEL